MKDIKEYINEKLKISKDNISHELIDILDVDVNDFSELKSILTSYLKEIYGVKNITVTDSRYSPVKWPLLDSINSKSFIPIGEHYKITAISKDYKIIFIIEIGREHSVNNRVVFRYKIGEHRTSYSRAIPNTLSRMYKLGTNFLQWLKDLKEYAEQLELSCKHELELLKFLKIE